MLVSFIIPAYNAAGTIVRCLDSIRILSLDKEGYEIIVIDDASTDETVSIIEDWRLKIENLILLKQPENHRQGAARNRGVKVAKGEYICFVDADDAVSEGIVKAIRLAKEKNTDMVPYHLAYADEKGNITKEEKHLSFGEGHIFTGIEMQNKHPYWLSGPVVYVYSREFLERVDYPFTEGVLYEDSDFVVVHLYYAKRMVYSHELGYLAYERDGSTTRSVNYKNVADYLLLGVRMLRFYERIKDERMNGLEDVGIDQFAGGILEGACYNIANSCRRMIKLSDIKEVGAFYKRVDTMENRKELCNYTSLRMYYWTIWTTICMKHKYVAMLLLSGIIPLMRIRRLFK